eukprot:TRINITY_DN1513_c0_g1_i1.p1 TRINITY_DN1513_c0_g1~~TRINITY_DN1513_c0_g1_i1.p1  ORF type:complete len:291 (-),score=85.77 TRINITY_DN1513_c0_g1_i1:231-1103(-)
MSSLKELHLKSLDTMRMTQRAPTIAPLTPASTTTTTTTKTQSKPPSNGKAKASSSSTASSSKKSVSVQHMTNVKSKTGQRVIFDILNFLQKEDKPLSKGDISLSTNHEITTEVEETLSTNPKINVLYNENGEKMYSFKPAYEIKNKENLVELLSTQFTGLPLIELKDSYKDVEKDARKLAEEKRIYLIKNPETKTEVLFPIDPQYQITILPEFVELWKEIKIPDAVDLEATMNEAGISMMEAPVKAVRKLPSKEKEKKKRRLNLNKITNKHMLDILDLSKDYEPQPKKTS